MGLFRVVEQERGARKSRWEFMAKVVIRGNGTEQESPMLTRYRLAQTPWFGVYVHQIHRADADQDCHDHPWRFVTWVIRGGYVEELRRRPARPGGSEAVWRGRWSVHAMPLRYAHRLTDVQPNTWTLLLVGPKRQGWGFWVDGQAVDTMGWGGASLPAIVQRPLPVRHVPWQQYVASGGRPDPFETP